MTINDDITNSLKNDEILSSNFNNKSDNNICRDLNEIDVLFYQFSEVQKYIEYVLDTYLKEFMKEKLYVLNISWKFIRSNRQNIIKIYHDCICRKDVDKEIILEWIKFLKEHLDKIYSQFFIRGLGYSVEIEVRVYDFTKESVDG